MTKKILQYNQEEVINLNLSIRDLALINYFIDNDKLNKEVNLKEIFKDLPIIFKDNDGLNEEENERNYNTNRKKFQRMFNGSISNEIKRDIINNRNIFVLNEEVYRKITL